MNEPQHEMLDEQVRTAFEGVNLAPDRLRAMVRQAGSARAPWATTSRRMTSALVLLAAMLALGLAVWPSVRPPAPGPSPGAPAPVVPALPPEPTPVAPALPPEPAPHTSSAVLSVRSDRRALVYIDDELVGYAPQELPISVGRHDVRAVLPGVPETEQRKRVQVGEATDTVRIEFVFASPAPAPVEPVAVDLQGLWVGSVKPGDRSLKLNVLDQRGGSFEGTVDLQLPTGLFESFAVEGTIEGQQVTFQGHGATFTGGVDAGGQRGSGTASLRDGTQLLWSAVHPR
jgi:hypothetical protein